MRKSLASAGHDTKDPRWNVETESTTDGDTGLDVAAEGETMTQTPRRRGRSARGNGGPGNPFARRVAGLRAAVLDAVTEDDLREIVRAVVGAAKKCDLAAVKLLLGYCVGRPADAVDPDRVEIDRLKLRRKLARNLSQAGWVDEDLGG
jgi:hypothetical protein